MSSDSYSLWNLLFVNIVYYYSTSQRVAKFVVGSQQTCELVANKLASCKPMSQQVNKLAVCEAAS